MCKMCPLLCGLDVHVEDGKIKQITGQEGHFLNVLCPKVDGMKEWVYSEDRIKSPLIKINGNWQQVSWDEAFSVIVDKLNVIDEGEEIGFDPNKDRFRCHIDASGIAIVPRGGKLIKSKEK